MMEPPPERAISGIANFERRNIDFTFTSITRIQSSSLSSTTLARRMIPALLKRVCKAPKSRMIRSTARRQSSARVTSVRSKNARAPLALISSAADFPSASFTSRIPTTAASLAKSNAAARPIPEAPPVIRATLPLRAPDFADSLVELSSLPAGHSAGDFSAVDCVDVAGHVCGVVGPEIREKRGDFFGARVASEGNLAIHLFEHFIRILGALHGREDISRGNGVDAHFWRELDGHGARQCDHARFGGV